MMGLRWRKPELRQSFFQLYNQRLAGDIFGRLEHLLGRQSWHSLSQQFWLEVVVQFIFSIATGPLTLAPYQLRVRSIAALEGASTGAAMPPAPSAGQGAMAVDPAEDMLGPSSQPTSGPAPTPTAAPASKADSEQMAVDSANRSDRYDRESERARE